MLKEHIFDLTLFKVPIMPAQTFPEKIKGHLPFRNKEPEKIPMKTRTIYVLPAGFDGKLRESLEDKLWKEFQGRQFLCDSVMKVQMAQGISGELDRYREAAQNEPKKGGETIVSRDPDGGVFDEVSQIFNVAKSDISEFAADIGLSVPLLRSAISAGKAGLNAFFARSASKKIGIVNKQVKVFTEARASYSQLAGQGLVEVFKEKRSKHRVQVGVYGVDALVGLFDPTPASKAITSGGLLMYKLWLLYKTNSVIKDFINPSLLNEGLFRKNFEQLFTRCPILASYIFFGTLDTSNLLGVCDHFDLSEGNATEDDLKRIAAMIHENIDKTEINRLEKIRKESLEPCIELAKKRQLASPYVLLEKDGRIPQHLPATSRVLAKYL